jgi:hypothetical protein
VGGKAEERRAAWAQDTLPACRAREKAGRNGESHSRVRTGICERPEMRAENNGEVVHRQQWEYVNGGDTHVQIASRQREAAAIGGTGAWSKAGGVSAKADKKEWQAVGSSKPVASVNRA